MDECVGEIFIFGDQTDTFRASLRALLNVKVDPILQQFFKESYRHLRVEVLLQSSVDSDVSDQRFSSLLELLDLNLKGPQAVALDHALATVCHFGLFLEKCRKSQGVYPHRKITKHVGICTGSLAAAAITCCQSSLELLPVALQTVILAYRLGAHAAETGGQYHGGERGTQCWSIAVPNTGAVYATEAIARFAATKNLPLFSTPYISGVWNQGVTISGPPDILQDFRDFGSFHSTAALPIHAPYHAPHLYDTVELDRLVSQYADAADWRAWKHDRHVTPQGFGLDMSPHLELREAFSKAAKAMFIDQVDFGKILDNVKNHLHSSRVTKTSLVPIASSAASTVFQALGETVGFSGSTGPLDVQLNDEVVQPYSEDDTRESSGQHTARSKIAIVGMSFRLPHANNEDELWDLLRQGLDVHGVVPPTRWDVTTHVDTSERPRKNTSATPYGCWLQEPGLFDGRFFGMSPRECEQVDPAQRLALITAYEALEDGGIVPGEGSSQRDRVGVCYGATSNDWMETNSAQDIDTYMIPGGNRAFIPGRINYFFKFSGPSLAVDTACSSSLTAIHTACNILWQGEADTMLAGGANILTNPDFTAGLDRGRFLSRTGGCKTFDDSADGYCRGEGVVSLVLKRLEDAIECRDPIRGIIVNVKTNHSAEAESITRPSMQAQRNIFASVLDGLSPANVSYVEMHGTGTQVGDATEMGSLLEVIAPSMGLHRRTEAEVVHLGSVKANIGHGEAVAGATSLVKLLLMMKTKMIPPHVGIKTRINRRFPSDMAGRGVQITSKLIDWPNRELCPTRYALLNNFSAAGGNTALLLQEVTTPLKALEIDPRSAHPLVLSGKTATSLHENARAMISYLGKHPDLSVPSLSYTTTARRMHHRHRIAVTGTSIQQFISRLSSALDEESTVVTSSPRTVVFAFTGQGGHYLGMGRQLYHCLEGFRKSIDRYSQIALRNGFSPFLPLISQEKVEKHHQSSESVQLAIVALQMALTRLWSSWGITPSAVVGHSLGHYAALNAAGVISEADTIFLVGTRARLMQQHCEPGTHKMLCVQATQLQIASMLPTQADVEIACINSPHEVVLTGASTIITDLSASLSSRHISCRVLDVPFAFHSAEVDCILDVFQDSISGVTFQAPRVPVICPRRERVLLAREEFSACHLADHCRRQVNLPGALNAAQREGLLTDDTMFLEIGHNRSVTAMLKAVLGTSVTAYPSLTRNKDPWTTLVHAVNHLYLAGLSIKWNEYHRGFSNTLQVISLPHYKWDLQIYWIQYRNDWSLRKGDPVSSGAIGSAPSLLSTTIHQVIKDEPLSGSRTITVLSDMNAPEFRPILQGHKVNGIPLATPSIYADIGFTIAVYIRGKHNFGHGTGGQISLTSMTVEKALVVPPLSSGPSPWLQTEVEFNSERGAFDCTFSSFASDNTIPVVHARCTITYDASSTAAEAAEQTSKTIANIDAVRGRLRSGASNCLLFTSNMVYRMVAVLAQFDSRYQGLKEVVLDSNAMAATSKIIYSTLPKHGCERFTVHPAHLDALTQTAGFVMNANEASDLDVECFVNHGWDALTLLQPLRAEKEYECYVQMVREAGSNGIWKGDLSVICENTLVAMVKGITLQGLPMRLLHQVLSTAQNTQSKGGTQNGRLPFSLASYAKEGEFRDTDASAPYSLSDQLHRIAVIVAEESGIPSVELDDAVELSSIGIDSLLALLITSRLKEELDFDVGSGMSIFDKFRTLKDLKEGFLKATGQMSEDLSAPASSQNEPWETSNSSVGDEIPQKDIDGQMRAVTSITLHQAAAHESPIFFLFPDGSGSPISYAPLAALATSSTMTFVSLICPYRKSPKDLENTSIDALLTLYIEEVRRRQPHGRYSLGGWSAGGILAYRASQMLIEQGEKVQHLILIDSPAPLHGLERLPQRFYEHCTSAGLFGQIEGSQPDWLVPHFNATIDLLSSYCASPMSAASGAVALIVWAGQAVLHGDKHPRFELLPEDGEGVRFLAQPRADFGPGAWGQLLGDIPTRILVLEEFDHFDMMYGGGARDLMAALGDFLAAAVL